MNLELTLSENRETLEIKATAGALDAAQVEELIEQFIRCRADMLPRRPSIDPFPGTRVITSPSARWYMDGAESGDVLLGIMHPGLGWVGIPLDLEGAASLSAQAVRAAAKATALAAQKQDRPPHPDNPPQSE